MRDNHPRKRQAKKIERKLERAKSSRKGLPFLLIVCEGAETEPNYVRGLCETRRINLAGIDIRPGGGATDARSLVKKAIELFKTNDYDRVFVVMDDEGQPLEEAKQLAGKRLKTAGGESIQVELITSRPSFEFWLLLHFEYSSRPYATAAMVMNSLRAYLTNYSKSDEHVFAHVDAGLERALTNVSLSGILWVRHNMREDHEYANQEENGSRTGGTEGPAAGDAS
jgi:hypothetical protein